MQSLPPRKFYMICNHIIFITPKKVQPTLNDKVINSYLWVKAIESQVKIWETSFGVLLSAGNQCMRTPRFMKAGINLNKSGVVTCKTSFMVKQNEA